MTDDYTVGAAAEMTGVSVRTLHHYDQIGLVRPSSRSPAGYRLYTEADLGLLQRVLFYRELDMDLGDIAGVVSDPEITDEAHLRRQREMIEQRIARSRAMLAVIDRELAARRGGVRLTPEERRKVWGGDRLVEHLDEAERQWGHQPSFVQRQQRTASYTEQDWLKLRDELHAIHRGLADAMGRGVPATDPVAMDLAEDLRQHTDRWFHDCGYDEHRELAELYRTNRRSGRNYDDMAPGLSQYVHDAIMANCDRVTGLISRTGGTPPA
jgi:DNA-binding transcriptional MerR regulator